MLGEFLRIVDNTTTLFGDDLKRELSGATKFRIAAACFSIYAFDALKSELGKLKQIEFIPTSAVDWINKERRECFISYRVDNMTVVDRRNSLNSRLRDQLFRRGQNLAPIH
jgi:hypothetical protein